MPFCTPKDWPGINHFSIALQGISDATGRENLIRYLRTLLMQKIATRLDCNCIARGDSATTFAAHIVSSAAQGRGYALPGDLQPVDARCASADCAAERLS